MDKSGLIPLHIAVRSGDLAILKMLLDRKDCAAQLSFPCTVPPFQQYRALHFACTYSAPEMNMERVVDMLLDTYAADIHATTEERFTALHVAVQSDSRACALTLMKHGADPCKQSAKGRTPLMIAASLGNEDMVLQILEFVKRGSDLDLVDQYGDTAFHFAFQSLLQRVLKNGFLQSFSHECCAYVIARAGARIDVLCNEGYMAIDFCSKHLAVIIRMVHKYPLLLPSRLKQLLDSQVDYRGIESQDIKLLEEAIKGYKTAIEDQANTILEKDATPSNDLGNSNNNITHLKHEDKPSEIVAIQGDLSDKKKKEYVLPEKYQGLPDYIKDKIIESKHSGAKCPLGFTAEDDDEKGSNTRVSPQQPNDNSIETTVNTNGQQKPTGNEKCPIPHHNKVAFLFSPKFLIPVAAAVIVYAAVKRYRS